MTGKTLMEVFTGEKPSPSIIPRAKHVALQRLEKKVVRRKSGIELPDDYQGMPHLGEVVRIGSECTEVDVGDKVWFDLVMGREITLDTGTFVLVHVDDLIAKLEE